MILRTARVLRLPPTDEHPDGRTVTQPVNIRTETVNGWSPALIGDSADAPYTDVLIGGAVVTIVTPYAEMCSLMDREHGSRIVGLQTKLATH